MFTVIGSCAKCGAPIYTNTMWFGTTAPPSMYSCACVHVSQVTAAAPLTPPVKIQMHTAANPTIIEEHSTGDIIYG